MTPDQSLIETATKYIKYEILANEHGICGREKQSQYALKQNEKCWVALEALLGCNNAMNLINDISEKHHSEIEKKALGL